MANQRTLEIGPIRDRYLFRLTNQRSQAHGDDDSWLLPGLGYGLRLFVVQVVVQNTRIVSGDYIEILNRILKWHGTLRAKDPQSLQATSRITGGDRNLMQFQHPVRSVLMKTGTKNMAMTVLTIALLQAQTQIVANSRICRLRTM